MPGEARINTPALRILFITTQNLASNPRLYKEIQLAISKGFEVEIICFEFDNWSKEINTCLKQELGSINIISIPAGRNPLCPWLWSVFTETTLRTVAKFLPLGVSSLSQAVSRRSDLIIGVFKKMSKPDWVIGHTPGAMWPVLKAAKNFNCKAGFDVEDYHAGEGRNIYLQNFTRKLMRNLLPQMSYVSFAAPLILQQVQSDTNVDAEKWFTVMNYFPAAEFPEPSIISGGPLKMVWFSQNINEGRGLELILPLIKQSKHSLELHLIGNINNGFYEKHVKGIPNIIVHAPMTQKNLHQALNQYDIGLALDLPVDANRNLVITNKLIAYLQSGIYVLATNTKAQYALLNDLPGYGLCFDYKTNDVATVLEKIVADIGTIRYHKQNRYKNFKENWESASALLLKAWTE